MNIIILAEVFTKSGVGKYIYELSNKLAADNKVWIMSPTNDWDLNESENLHFIKLYRMDKKPSNLYKNVKILDKVIKENKIDIIHANHRMAAMTAKIRNIFHKNVPVVWTCHTAPYPTNLIKKILGYHGDKTIAISPEAYDFCSNTLKLNKNNICVVYNGVDESRLKPLTDIEKSNIYEKYNIDKNKFIISIHGRIDKVKGHDVFIKALEELPQDLLDRITILCSGDTTTSYSSEVKSLLENSSKRIDWIFTGWIDTRDILGVSDLLVQPSRREGFPLTCIEAFFMRVPMIRTKTGGYAAMTDLCVGIDKEDYHRLADEILDAYQNYDKFNAMISKAYDRACNEFTLDVMANKTYNVYKAAIKEN